MRTATQPDWFTTEETDFFPGSTAPDPVKVWPEERAPATNGFVDPERSIVERDSAEFGSFRVFVQYPGEAIPVRVHAERLGPDSITYYTVATTLRAGGPPFFAKRPPTTAGAWTVYPPGLMAVVRPPVTEIDLRRLEAEAESEMFEDGVASAFSEDLVRLFVSGPAIVAERVERWASSTGAGEELASEALRWLGRLDHPPTHDLRLELLCKLLGSSSPSVRDAAGLGLASLGDARALHTLTQALVKEDVREVREGLEAVITDLAN